MDYIPRIIEGITVEEIDRQIAEMRHLTFAFGQPPDRPRLWDLEATRKKLLQEAEKGA